MINLIPIFALLYFLYAFKQNHLNSVLVGFVFLSFLFFATNYSTYGFDISIYRYIHRFIGVIVGIALLIYIYKHKVNIFKDKVIILFISFFIILLLSFIGNEVYLAHYIHYVRNFIFISAIVLYLYFSLDNKEKVEELFSLIIKLTALLAFFVIIEVLSHHLNGGELWGGKRIKLFYSNPNYLAYALLPGFVFTIFSKIKYKHFFVLLILISIFATGSRSVELSSIFVIFIYIFFNLKNINKRFLFIGFFSITISLPFSFDKIIFNQNIDSVRIVLAKVSLNAFNSNPLNGIGYGQFRTKYYQFIDTDIIKINNNSVNDGFKSHDKNLSDLKLGSEGLTRNMQLMTHNDFLTVASELGIFGLIFLVFIFFKLYIEFKKLLSYSRLDFFLCASLSGGSLIFSMFHNNLTSMMFWFILILPFIMNRNYQKLK